MVEYVFDLDRTGNSKPYSHAVPKEWLAQEKKKEAELTAIAASAEQRLDGQLKAGKPYDPVDFETFARARGLSTQDKIAIKLDVNRSGRTIQQSMKFLHIG